MDISDRAARALGPGLIVVFALGLAACSATGPARPSTGVAKAPAGTTLAFPASPLTEDQRILHVLDRLGYGPRPGDLDRVKRMGLAVYLEGQLRPESIRDEAVERRLAEYPTLTMSTAALLRAYPRPDPAVAQRVQSGEMTQREANEMYPPEKRPNRIVAELQAAKMLRAVASERQLQEVMVDFWFNHFNVFVRKDAVRWMLTSYERDVIRPHALGRFRDLLLATARHPAMLFYLDNWVSVREVVARGPNSGRRAGLNENYARELMELHTLGVDAGYTQQDVVEVARCFTGWTIDRPREEGAFLFRLGAHDQGEKRVLGRVMPAGGGEADGLAVIEMLSRHPATARFIATKLARRLVHDEPPPALVEWAARAFTDTDGDIRAVLASIITSPEFFSAAAHRVKVKTPLELAASAVRALDGEVQDPSALARAVAGLGQPLYEAEVPTGYADVAHAWVNTGALVGRMSFALRLAENRIPGIRLDVERVRGDRAGVSDRTATRQAALLVGAPEFQRR